VVAGPVAHVLAHPTAFTQITGILQQQQC
jgi:hypothetical protein